MCAVKHGEREREREKERERGTQTWAHGAEEGRGRKESREPDSHSAPLQFMFIHALLRRTGTRSIFLEAAAHCHA